MDSNGSVNGQITDAVTQINTLIIGNAPPQALGFVEIAGAEAISMFMYNAVSAQQNAQISSTAATTSVCAKILQAQLPQPAKPVSPVKPVPPPFLPLDPTFTATELLSEANSLAQAAINTATQNSTQLSPKMLAELQTLINNLQNIVKSDSSTTQTPLAPQVSDSSPGADQGKKW